MSFVVENILQFTLQALLINQFIRVDGLFINLFFGLQPFYSTQLTAIDPIGYSSL